MSSTTPQQTAAPAQTTEAAAPASTEAAAVAVLPPKSVVLENIPAAFSQKVLGQVVAHGVWKGSVIEYRYVGGYEPHAVVTFELQEDLESAVKLWDQLCADECTITAWSTIAHPDRNIPSGGTARPTHPAVPPPQTQQTSGLRYPFGSMQIAWLISYVNGLPQPDRSYTMCRILECLMTNAVATNDSSMEYAVINFYTKFTVTAWNKAQKQMANSGVPFELCRQVFEVLGLVRKYPGANVKSRKMLVSLVERLMDDIQPVSETNAELQSNKAIPNIINSIRTTLDELKVQPDSDHSLKQLLKWLKWLFSCLSAHHAHGHPSPDAPPIYHCSEDCECYQRNKHGMRMFIHDVEKCKIIDCLIIAAVQDADSMMSNIARELLERYPVNFCLRAVQWLHNSEYAYLRFCLFDAIRFAKQTNTEHYSRARQHYDDIESTLHVVKEHFSRHILLRDRTKLIDNALKCIYVLRETAETTPATVQQLCTLQYDLGQLFVAIAGVAFQLCVHEEDHPRVAPTAAEAALAQLHRNAGLSDEPRSPARCANPACDTGIHELMKCSGCKVNYYCSIECQKADWKVHKSKCKELAVKKQNAGVDVNSMSAPGSDSNGNPLPTALRGEERLTMKPAFLSALETF